MQVRDSHADSRRSPEAVPASKVTAPDSASSQAFYRQLPLNSVKRSLIVSAVGSTVGMVMFGVVQGTVINFFFEDLDLKERIPWFTGLLWLSGIGSLFGSWIQESWGHRRALMISCCGLSRLTWLFMGLLPFVWPHKVANGGLFFWLSACTIVFYFVHSVGANAWLAWMSDLVPPEYQARFWTWRQVGTYTSNSVAQLGFGWYLERHRANGMSCYAIIFALATLAGVLDVASYFFVEHREPRRMPARHGVLTESFKRLKDSAFQKLCGVYLFWLAANCIMTPTAYFFWREEVMMGPYSASLCMTVSMAGFAISSLFWGRFADREGHRRGVLACLVLQNVAPVFYLFCGPNSIALTTLASTLQQIGLGGVTLFMFPMLIDYTKGKGGGRAVGMAAFTALLSIVGFASSVVADRHIYNWIAALFNACSPDKTFSPRSGVVYLSIMGIAFILRSAALLLAWLLPPCEKQRAAGPGALILRRMSATPLRAAQNILAFATSRFSDDDSDQDKDENDYSKTINKE